MDNIFFTFLNNIVVGRLQHTACVTKIDRIARTQSAAGKVDPLSAVR